MAGNRLCKHCGGEYRGLACPCRKRAWRELRERDAAAAAAAIDAAASKGEGEHGDDPSVIRGPGRGEFGSGR